MLECVMSVVTLCMYISGHVSRIDPWNTANYVSLSSFGGVVESNCYLKRIHSTVYQIKKSPIYPVNSSNIQHLIA